MANKIGLSTFVLASPFSNEDLHLMSKVKDIGYDVIEICIEDPSKLSAELMASAAEKHGLEIFG